MIYKYIDLQQHQIKGCAAGGILTAAVVDVQQLVCSRKRILHIATIQNT